MRKFEWDKSLEELCSSEQEVQELKEIASMFCDLPKVQSSSSFRDTLKNNLLKKAKGIKTPRRKLFASPLFTAAAAAAVLAIIAISVFFSPGQVDPKITSPGDPSSLEITQVDPRERAADPSPGREDTTEPPSADEQGNGTVEPSFEESTPKDNSSGDSEPSTTDTPIEEPLQEEPEFEAWRNEKSFKLAGQVLLSPVYYNVTAEEGITPAQNVNHSWKPRKFVAAAGVASAVGSEAWARELLLNEGFMPNEVDYLKINSQETQKGFFVEVFYRDQKSSDRGLTLVLHFQEGKGILNYYYEEMGEITDPGFYPIFSPQKAFEQANNLEWFGPTQRLDFSFREATLTNHVFTIEENGLQKSLKLPAYCFLGMETFNNGGVLKVYLPAVK